MKRLVCLVMVSVCIGCSEDTRQKLPTNLAGSWVSNLDDGEAAWIDNDSLIVDTDRYIYVDHSKLSSPKPTHYRVFKYNGRFDLYMEAEYFVEHKPDSVNSRCVNNRNIPIENIIIVDDISSVDLDIAKRLDRLKTVEIALD